MVGAALLVVAARPAVAQRLQAVWIRNPDPFAARAALPPLMPADSNGYGGSRVAGGLAGAAAGAMAGVLVGGLVFRAAGCTVDSCSLRPLAVGIAISESIGMALGARGNLLVSTGIALAGLAGASAAGTPYVLIAVPVVQLAVLLRL